MKKYKIGAVLEHADAAAAYRAATGKDFPRIPSGKNTVWVHFTTCEGRPAVIVNQRGFAATAGDDEQECNGCSLAIMLDDVPEQEARRVLESWILETLELER